MKQTCSILSKRVIIIRHERTRENNIGIVQGQNIDGVLEKEEIDPNKLAWLRKNISGQAIIICSSLARAEHSGNMISSSLNIPILVTPLLKQRCWGIIEGKTLKELGNSFVKDAFSSDADKLAQGSESLSDIYYRVRTIWEFVLNLTEITVIIITHDEFSNYLINHILGEGLFKRPLSYNEAHVVELSNGNIQSILLHSTIIPKPFTGLVAIREDASTFKTGENGLGIRILNNNGIDVVDLSDMSDFSHLNGLVVGDKPFTDDDLERYQEIKVVSRFGKGINNIRINNRDGLFVTNTPNCNEQAVAEFTIGQILELVKRINFSRSRLIKKNLWERPFTKEWRQVTVGILGLGLIGKIVAKILIDLGFKVIIWTAHPFKHSEFLRCNNVSLVSSVNELCSLADIITLHTSVNNDTIGLIGKEQFELMKTKKACLVNTARSELFDYKFLKTALKKGWIGGAAIDVWPEEPIKSLWLRQLICHTDIVATPHIAGRTKAAISKAISLCAYNVVWVTKGRPELASCVSF